MAAGRAEAVLTLSFQLPSSCLGAEENWQGKAGERCRQRSTIWYGVRDRTVALDWSRDAVALIDSLPSSCSVAEETEQKNRKYNCLSLIDIAITLFSALTRQLQQLARQERFWLGLSRPHPVVLGPRKLSN